MEICLMLFGGEEVIGAKEFIGWLRRDYQVLKLRER
jgi:hypothetical protein